MNRPGTLSRSTIFRRDSIHSMILTQDENKYMASRKRIMLQSNKTRNDTIIWYHHKFAQEPIGKVNRNERKEPRT